MLERIAVAAPPASRFEGRLQRWREAVDDVELETVWSGGEGLTSFGDVRTTRRAV